MHPGNEVKRWNIASEPSALSSSWHRTSRRVLVPNCQRRHSSAITHATEGRTILMLASSPPAAKRKAFCQLQRDNLCCCTCIGSSLASAFSFCQYTPCLVRHTCATATFSVFQFFHHQVLIDWHCCSLALSWQRLQVTRHQNWHNRVNMSESCFWHLVALSSATFDVPVWTEKRTELQTELFVIFSEIARDKRRWILGTKESNLNSQKKDSIILWQTHGTITATIVMMSATYCWRCAESRNVHNFADNKKAGARFTDLSSSAVGLVRMCTVVFCTGPVFRHLLDLFQILSTGCKDCRTKKKILTQLHAT